MGSKCHRSIYSRLAGGIDCFAHSDTGLYSAIQMVVAGYLQPGSSHSSINNSTGEIIQEFNAKRFSPAKQLDKAGHVYRNTFYDLFLFFFMNKIILASQSPRRKQLLEW